MITYVNILWRSMADFSSAIVYIPAADYCTVTDLHLPCRAEGNVRLMERYVALSSVLHEVLTMVLLRNCLKRCISHKSEGYTAYPATERLDPQLRRHNIASTSQLKDPLLLLTEPKERLHAAPSALLLTG